MKTFKYLFASVLVGLLGVSCHSLDIMPKNIMTEADLLTSDAGIQKYFAIAYHDLPIEDFNFRLGNPDDNDSGYVQKGNIGNYWVAQKGSPTSVAAEASGRATSYDGFDYWDFKGTDGPYYRIRQINHFLQTLPSYADSHTADRFNEYLAEARFLRAFYYFALVKFHGGVVLMNEALDPMAAASEQLTQARSTEYDSWKFIYEDLKFAMENGAEKSETGRMNRYVAAALMTRAMLYAGTIAKYGHYTGISGDATAAGLMGMPQDRAAEFFQYVLDAGKIVQDGGYTLHTGNDKAAAFAEMFITNTAEDIFIKEYGLVSDGVPQSTGMMHNWDNMVLPKGTNLAADIGCALDPAWNLVSLYDHPAIVDENGNPTRFDSPEAFWDSPEMEARARGTIYFSGMTETTSGTVFNFQAGVYTNYTGTAEQGTADVSMSQNEYTGEGNNGRRRVGDGADKWMMIDGENVRLTGLHGTPHAGGDEGPTGTGMVIRKYVSNTTLRSHYQSKQAWKAFRYGEVLLNRAEAAYELGLETGNADLKAEAFTYIAQLRTRAGASEYVMKDAPEDIGSKLVEDGGKGYPFSVDENLQFIRDERARELAFENHRIFDMMRWRVADLEFQSLAIRALMSYKVLDEDKWIFLAEVDPQGRRVSFDRKNYYRNIPGGARERNKLLIPNDGH